MIIRVRTSKGTKKLEVPADCTVGDLRLAISSSDGIGLDKNLRFELSNEFPGMSKDAKLLLDQSKSLSEEGLKHGDLCYVIQTSPSDHPTDISKSDDSDCNSKEIAPFDEGIHSKSITTTASSSSLPEVTPAIVRDPDEEATLALVRRLEKEEREVLGRHSNFGDHDHGAYSSSGDKEHVRSPEPTKVMNLVNDDLHEIAHGDAHLARLLNSKMVDDMGYPTRNNLQIYDRMHVTGIEGARNILGAMHNGGVGGDDMQRAIQLSMLDRQNNGKHLTHMKFLFRSLYANFTYALNYGYGRRQWL